MRNLDVTPLTAAELERSANGPCWDHILPAEVFSSAADGTLAQRIFTSNPAKYFALRQEWRYIIGAERRPDEYYQQA
jgi:hypothetical protein